MKSVRTTLAYVAAAALVAFGLLALLNPLVAARLVGLEVVEPRGLSEVRAFYGAMMLMLGGVMVWAVPMRPRSAPWMRLAGLLWAAATLGRAASVILDGVWTPVNLLFLLASGVIAAAFILASFQTRPGAIRRSDDERPSQLASSRDGREPARRGWLRRSKHGPAQAADRGDDAEEDEGDPLRAYRS